MAVRDQIGQGADGGPKSFHEKADGIEEQSRNRFRSGLYAAAAGQGIGARAARPGRARHEGRDVGNRSLKRWNRGRISFRTVGSKRNYR